MCSYNVTVASYCDDDDDNEEDDDDNNANNRQNVRFSLEKVTSFNVH